LHAVRAVKAVGFKYTYYVVHFMKGIEIKVTRKYQITIPNEIRKSLGIKIGEKYPIKRFKNKIIIETRKRIEKPSDYLWSISKRRINLNAVKLVKNSREKMR